MPRRHFLTGKAFLLGMNPVIRFLTISDVVILGAMQLLAPVFAIFVIERIDGGNVAVAGLAVAIFLVSKSVFQIPVASVMDRIQGERDDFLFMFWGTIAASAAQIGYLFISTPLELYVIQIILGVSSAITFPSYMAIFTRHIDKQKEGMEWGVRFTLTDLSAAFGASVGGFFALTYGFDFLIILTVVISILGTLFLLPINRWLKKR